MMITRRSYTGRVVVGDIYMDVDVTHNRQMVEVSFKGKPVDPYQMPEVLDVTISITGNFDIDALVAVMEAELNRQADS